MVLPCGNQSLDDRRNVLTTQFYNGKRYKLTTVELSWQYLRRSTFDRRPWSVYHAERPLLREAWCTRGDASRGSVCDGWYLLNRHWWWTTRRRRSSTSRTTPTNTHISTTRTRSSTTESSRRPTIIRWTRSRHRHHRHRPIGRNSHRLQLPVYRYAWKPHETAGETARELDIKLQI